MKTVFEQVKELLDTANAALGEVDWHTTPPMGKEPSAVVRAMMMRKLGRTQAIVDSLKEKASK